MEWWTENWFSDNRWSVNNILLMYFQYAGDDWIQSGLQSEKIPQFMAQYKPFLQRCVSVCHHSMSHIWSCLNTIVLISLSDAKVHFKWDSSGMWWGNEYGNINCRTPTRNNYECESRVSTTMCSQLNTHLYSVLRAYGLCCHLHLDNRTAMHYN